ncbi:MAG TPA: hypothetical protein VNO70_15795, partial [Blastocatellia bacterium]|nr:hypothetical protein [Blastocatellia bacterium]
LRREDFRAEYDRRLQAFLADRHAAMRRAGAQLAHHAGGMVDVLVSVANNTAQPAGVRVRAACAVLELAAKMEAQDLAERVAQIEAALKKRK